LDHQNPKGFDAEKLVKLLLRRTRISSKQNICCTCSIRRSQSFQRNWRRSYAGGHGIRLLEKCHGLIEFEPVKGSQPFYYNLGMRSRSSAMNQQIAERISAGTDTEDLEDRILSVPEEVSKSGNNELKRTQFLKTRCNIYSSLRQRLIIHFLLDHF